MVEIFFVQYNSSAEIRNADLFKISLSFCLNISCSAEGVDWSHIA